MKAKIAVNSRLMTTRWCRTRRLNTFQWSLRPRAKCFPSLIQRFILTKIAISSSRNFKLKLSRRPRAWKVHSSRCKCNHNNPIKENKLFQRYLTILWIACSNCNLPTKKPKQPYKKEKLPSKPPKSRATCRKTLQADPQSSHLTRLPRFQIFCRRISLKATRSPNNSLWKDRLKFQILFCRHRLKKLTIWKNLPSSKKSQKYPRSTVSSPRPSFRQSARTAANWVWST